MQDRILERFYEAIARDDENFLKRVHIPRSEVFYVRLAIFNDTGEWYSLDRVERAMFLEGMLDRKDVFKPDTPRGWEESDEKDQ